MEQTLLRTLKALNDSGICAAARMLSDNLEEPYERELAKGGVLLLVWLRGPEQAGRARALLGEWGADAVRDYEADAEIPTGVLAAR